MQNNAKQIKQRENETKNQNQLKYYNKIRCMQMACKITKSQKNENRPAATTIYWRFDAFCCAPLAMGNLAPPVAMSSSVSQSCHRGPTSEQIEMDGNMKIIILPPGDCTPGCLSLGFSPALPP